MKRLIFIFFIIVSFPVRSEIMLELSGKKLPVFNMPLIKDNENFYLIEKDPINKISYVAHKSCFNFKIIALTENRKLFLDEKDIANLVETAHDYADIFCPNSNRISLVAATGLSLEKEEMLFQTSIVGEEKWEEQKYLRKNHVLEKETARVAALREKLEALTLNERLALLLDVPSLDSLPRLTLDAWRASKEKEISALILIDELGDNYVSSSYPINAEVYGLPEKVGYYLVKGTLSSQEGQKKMLHNTIKVKSFIECRKKGCSEFQDVGAVIGRKNR